MGPLAFLILLVVVGAWLVAAYNGLIALKNQTLNAFKQIDVQLKRRHDLIPNLVNAVRGAMDFARQLYNDTATQYNTKQQQFPTSLVAGLAKTQPADLWEIEDQGEKAVPQVDLSLKPKT